MALKLKDLKQREYRGRDCVAFQTRYVDADADLDSTLMFMKIGPTLWNVSCLFINKSSQNEIISTDVELPSKSIKLETVAGMGMVQIAQILERDVSRKQILLASLLKDALGE